MKKISLMFLILTLAACSKVPAGNVGVKVYLLGKSKGVDMEVLPVGRYWIGWNQELYLFPVFAQNYTWTKGKDEGSQNDESISFQDRDGTSLNADLGITYQVNPQKVATVFQTYRRGVEEITDIFLRNQVRDALNKVASAMSIDEINGPKKDLMMIEVQKIVSDEVKPIGIDISKIYLVSGIRINSEIVRTALNAKIEATQRAQQRENELRESEAEAKKKIAQAEGEAQSTLLKAQAEAKANKIVSESITPELISYEITKKWSGELPKVTGETIPLLKLPEIK